MRQLEQPERGFRLQVDGADSGWRPLKSRRWTWLRYLSAQIREGIVLGVQWCSRCLVDRIGITSLPGYRPVVGLMLRPWLRRIRPYIDADFYLEQIDTTAARKRAERDPALHYVLTGWVRGFAPSADFDPHLYRKHRNLHWARDPLWHFAKSTGDIKKLQRLYAASAPPSRYQAGQPVARKTPARLVVYTAVAGGYDVLRAPEYLPENCDFVAFSDRPLQVEGWDVRPLNYEHRDPSRAARFVKLHPHLYFPEYEHSIWLDANLGVRGDISQFLDRLTDDSYLSTFMHPLRDCIYAEGDECIKRWKDSKVLIKQQLQRYRKARFPRAGGLWETNVLVRRHNDPSCIALMGVWWRELDTGSKRDQLSLPIAARRLSAVISPLDLPGAHAREHPLLTYSLHVGSRVAAEPGEATLPNVRRRIDPDRVSVTVGVCVHNSFLEVRDCLRSLLRGCGSNTKIIVVDDASDERTAQHLRAFAARNDRVELVRHEITQGYTRSANQVLMRADSDWIVLLNSDTIVPPRALDKLIEAGEQYPRLAIVGPLSNAAGWQSVPELTGADGKFIVNGIPDSLTVDDMDRICELASRGAVSFVPLVNGFCYAVRRSMLKEVGFFDDEMFPVGYGEEDDLCIRAANYGYVCGIATDAYVFHSKSASFTSARRDVLVTSGKRALRRKHGADRIAAAVATMRHHPRLKAMREDIARLQREFELEEVLQSRNWRNDAPSLHMAEPDANPVSVK
jgi:O-antigen biosynthesis protein